MIHFKEDLKALSLHIYTKIYSYLEDNFTLRFFK